MLTQTIAPPRKPAFCVPSWCREAAKILDLQLWLFGYDIRRREGNLLIAMGCERIPAPEADTCSSCYRVTLPSGPRLTLRGFGLLCEASHRPHAVFLSRSDFAVNWFESGFEGMPWRASDLPKNVSVPPHAHEEAADLLARLAGWIAEYEEFVCEEVGIDYRSSAIQERDRDLAAAAFDPRVEWRRIESDLAI